MIFIAAMSCYTPVSVLFKIKDLNKFKDFSKENLSAFNAIIRPDYLFLSRSQSRSNSNV